MAPRKINKPGQVKISFGSVDEKIREFRQKQNLSGIQGYSSVFLRSSKSHTERLLELNTKTFLNEIPIGRNFRVTANGRIVTVRKGLISSDSPVLKKG